MQCASHAVSAVRETQIFTDNSDDRFEALDSPFFFLELDYASNAFLEDSHCGSVACSMHSDYDTVSNICCIEFSTLGPVFSI